MALGLLYRPPAPTSITQAETTTVNNTWNYIDNVFGINQTLYTGGTGSQDIIDVTGSGVICALGYQAAVNPTTQSVVTNIDGVDVMTITSGIDTGGIVWVVGSGIYYNASVRWFTFQAIPFYRNFKVTIDADQSIGAGHKYYLT